MTLLPEHRTSTVVALIESWAADGFPVDWDRLPILADALEDAGFADAHQLAKLRGCDLSRWDLDDYKSVLVSGPLLDGDWEHVFAYAGEPGRGDGGASVRAVPPGSDVPASPFCRWDVADVLGISEGENDTQNWLVYGRLHDGRYFFLTAGCDYTGWG